MQLSIRLRLIMIALGEFIPHQIFTAVTGCNARLSILTAGDAHGSRGNQSLGFSTW
jgi:hypothetical protein